MMNLVKSQDYVNPNDKPEAIQILGCGSVGSNLAEHLARFGFKTFHLYDFDVVESRNLVNQMFTMKDISKPKVEAVRDLILSINDEASVEIHDGKWDEDCDPLFGYVFLCFDSIETRRKVIEHEFYNPMVRAVFDFRTALVEGQVFAADWMKLQDKKQLHKSMKFEKADAVPMTACGTEMGIATTVKATVDIGMMNFIQYYRTGKLRKVMNVNIESMEIV